MLFILPLVCVCVCWRSVSTLFKSAVISHTSATANTSVPELDVGKTEAHQFFTTDVCNARGLSVHCCMRNSLGLLYFFILHGAVCCASGCGIRGLGLQLHEHTLFLTCSKAWFTKQPNAVNRHMQAPRIWGCRNVDTQLTFKFLVGRRCLLAILRETCLDLFSFVVQATDFRVSEQISHVCLGKMSLCLNSFKTRSPIFQKYSIILYLYPLCLSSSWNGSACHFC